MAETLGELLVREKLVTSEQEGKAREAASARGVTSVQQLVSMGVLEELALQKFLSLKFSIPPVQLTNIQSAALKLIPIETVVKFRCLPFQIDADGSVRVALADPSYLPNIEKIKQWIGKPVTPVLTTFSTLESALRKISGAVAAQSAPAQPAASATQKNPGAPSPSSHLAAVPQMNSTAQAPAPTMGSHHASPAAGPAAQPNAANFRKVKKFRNTDSVVNILNEILAEGATKGASDIHIEPEATQIRVRFRLEGVLFEVFTVPIEAKDQLITRTKVIASMDIAERRVPQDGRAKITIGKSEISFRVNSMPSLYGENVVFRVLRQDSLNFDLAALGFDPDQLRVFRKGIESANGMILVTGPTGSGKTTTLYSALSSLNSPSIKITTLEDPIEYSLPGITQVQISKDTGLDFAEVLKSLLRQDPDVIFVGEIRDQETAKVAVQAALTGHIVMSSLHTNDAPSAITRLLNMGMEPFPVLEALRTVVGQQLVRKICKGCAEPIRISEEQIRVLGSDAFIVANVPLFRGVGCELCLGGGYRGRAAIYEVLEITDSVKELFLRGENLIAIKKHAISDGMRTLRQSALALVAAGVTTIDEALALTLE